MPQNNVKIIVIQLYIGFFEMISPLESNTHHPAQLSTYRANFVRFDLNTLRYLEY
jgi:hypothetical protein